MRFEESFVTSEKNVYAFNLMKYLFAKKYFVQYIQFFNILNTFYKLHAVVNNTVEKLNSSNIEKSNLCNRFDRNT